MQISEAYWNALKEAIECYLDEFVDHENTKPYDEFAFHAAKMRELCFRMYGEREFTIDDKELYFLNHILQSTKDLGRPFTNSKEFKVLHEQVSAACRM